MKILYHHRTVSKDGQDVHIEEMIAAFRRQGHDVIVVAPERAQNAGFGDDGGLISRIKSLLPGAVYEMLELFYSVPAYLRLKRAYLAHRPDILYERYNLLFLAGYWLKRRFGLPYILEVNAPLAHERAAFGGLKLRRIADWSERVVWRGADKALPVTDILADFLRRSGVAENRIEVIHNGINRQRFPEHLDSSAIRRELGLDGKLVLGFTGFIRSWHGLTHVVDLMAAMKDRSDLHLVVIGDGPAKAELEEHARKTGMQDRVTLLGLLPRDKVANYIAAFDIALQPRVVDYASPLKLFEYMGLGRAIVAPDQPNIREILTDGEDALLFDPDDPASFRNAIERLCRDEALRLGLGRAASRTIESKGFTWDNNARRVVAMAENLLTAPAAQKRTAPVQP